MFVPLLLFITIVLVVFLACAVHFVGGKCGSFSHILAVNCSPKKHRVFDKQVKKMFYVAMARMQNRNHKSEPKSRKKNQKKKIHFPKPHDQTS